MSHDTHVVGNSTLARPGEKPSVKDRKSASRPTNVSLQLITRDLARCADYPSGSTRHGYSFVAPLTTDGHLDADAWPEERHRCYVRRFWGDETARVGHLVHERGGAGGATWCFEYSDIRGTETERGHHLQDHRFVLGEYVSVLQDDEEMKTFKVIDVRKACSR
jgi:hypothetical protein